MSALTVYEAEVRSITGKGGARAARRSGKVPAVLYGQSKDPVALAVDYRLVLKEIHQAGFFSKLVEVKINGKAEHALPRDVQLHPVTDEPMHVDFLRVGKDSKIVVSVPLIFINEDKAPGVKKGGTLNIVAHSLEVRCPASSIPESFTVDLTGLEIANALHIDALKLPKEVTPTHPERDNTLVTIVAPGGGVKEEAAS